MEIEVEVECPICGELFTTVIEIETESLLSELD